jgi:hypothetical protein
MASTCRINQVRKPVQSPGATDTVSDSACPWLTKFVIGWTAKDKKFNASRRAMTARCHYVTNPVLLAVFAVAISLCNYFDQLSAHRRQRFPQGHSVSTNLRWCRREVA